MSLKKTLPKNRKEARTRTNLEDIRAFNNLLKESTGLTIGAIIDVFINGDVTELHRVLSLAATKAKDP